MADVVIKNLTKTYANGVGAVDQLTLSVADGELVVIVGPSGCGKTTTLRLVAGLEQASAGSICLGGRDVTGVPAGSRKVSMVFQETALYPHLSVAANLAFPLRLKKMPRADVDRRVREVAELLNVHNLLQRRPHELSGGQRRRVALARALAPPADVYLLDEPLSHLDAPARRVLRETIRTLHQQLRCTMIYVTHDQEEAMAVGQRLAVMRDGRLQQCDTPTAVYERPANRFVAGLFGRVPMNLVTGGLSRDGETLSFKHGDLRVSPPKEIADRLLPQSPSSIVLGIRPEAITPVAGNTLPGFTLQFRATVESMSELGDHVDLEIVTAGQTQLLASVRSADSLAIGKEQMFAVEPSDFHFFSTDPSGRNLARQTEEEYRAIQNRS